MRVRSETRKKGKKEKGGGEQKLFDTEKGVEEKKRDALRSKHRKSRGKERRGDS